MGAERPPLPFVRPEPVGGRVHGVIHADNGDRAITAPGPSFAPKPWACAYRIRNVAASHGRPDLGIGAARPGHPGGR